MKKSVLRKEMKLLRKSMDKNDRTAKDKKIFENLIKLDSFKSSSWFYVYVSYGTEADTKNLIEYLFELKKEREIHVAVPKVLGDEMDFFEINLFSELEKGCMGILEPSTGNKVKPENAVMVLPGLAFDEEHKRLGYGGGFYDKYLSKYGAERFMKVAVCYDFQMQKKGVIASDSNDIKVDMIVTDKAYY